MTSNKLTLGKYQTLARILAEISDIPEVQLYKSLDFCVAGMASKALDVQVPVGRCIVQL